MNSLDKHRSVAFSGHRRIPIEWQDSLRNAIKAKVGTLYAMGITDYYCGMAIGFDMLAAEVVLSLKATLPKLRLIAVVPYRGQPDAWSRSEQERHATILARADEVIVLSERYTRVVSFGAMTSCYPTSMAWWLISTATQKAARSTLAVKPVANISTSSICITLKHHCYERHSRTHHLHPGVQSSGQGHPCHLPRRGQERFSQGQVAEGYFASLSLSIASCAISCVSGNW